MIANRRASRGHFHVRPMMISIAARTRLHLPLVSVVTSLLLAACPAVMVALGFDVPLQRVFAATGCLLVIAVVVGALGARLTTVGPRRIAVTTSFGRRRLLRADARITIVRRRFPWPRYLVTLEPTSRRWAWRLTATPDRASAERFVYWVDPGR